MVITAHGFFPLHLLLSNSLRPLIKHGDPEKVSKVLTRFFFLTQKKAQTGLVIVIFSEVPLNPRSGAAGGLDLGGMGRGDSGIQGYLPPIVISPTNSRLVDPPCLVEHTD